MPSFNVETIRDAASGAEASILVSPGFNCFSWRAPLPGTGRAASPRTELREMFWAEPGFEAGDKRPSRSGTPLLFPFPGRIRGGQFEFAGTRYQLPVDDGLGNAIHGFALRGAWRVTDRADDRIAAEFRPTLDAPDAADHWPGDCSLTCSYRVAGGLLELVATVRNLGETASPFGFGTHAYFRLPLADGSDPEATIVRAPVDAVWRAEALVPDGKTTPLADRQLAEGAPLAGRVFDTPYRSAPASESLVTELLDTATGRFLRQTTDTTMTCCVIYTPGHREAICLEPYTCVPNPFEVESAGAASGLRVLAPGESYTTRIALEAGSV